MLGVFTDDFFPYIGGMGRYVHEVAKRLPPHRFCVFSPADNDIDNHHRVAPYLHARLRNIGFSLWLHRNIDALIGRWGLARINIQCGPGGLFVFKKSRVPLVATCYHTWWQQSRYIPAQFWKKIFMPFEIRTYRLADRIVCISQDSRDILVDKYGIRPAKTVVINPGVDTRRFFPLEGVEKTPDSLLYVGRVDRRKGVDFLVKAMPEVVRHLPDATLFIGGVGKDLDGLKAFAQTKGLEKNIRFLGFIPDESLNLWYNRVQCVVVPSVFEGFGLTAVESMAAGTGVICTAVDSLRHIVRDGVCGYQVDYGDSEGLSAKILSLLGDPERQRRFSEKATAQVREAYDWDVIMKKLGAELLGAT